MTLRAHMREVLAGWPVGAPAPWRTTFEGTAPSFGSSSLGIAHDGLARPAHPPLRAANDERDLFRAFRRIEPAEVRVAVIGQDPYPDPRRATGRPFEDGGAVQGLGVANSLRRLLQSGLTAMEPDLRADQDITGWDIIAERVEEHLANQAAMTDYFDWLAGQGVLFLNTAWTFTEIEPHPDRAERERRLARVQRAHKALWRPVMLRLIEALKAQNPLECPH